MNQTAKRDAGKLAGEYSAEFDRLRQARVNASFYKYGPARKNFGGGPGGCPGHGPAMSGRF